MSTKGSNTPNALNAPRVPSLSEANLYYYGIYSKPRLIARSNTSAWIDPQGTELYLTPKELRPLGFDHPLGKIWEPSVAPEMVRYLDDEDVKCSSLDPVRIGYADDPSPPAILWVGVLPDSLTGEVGVMVAVHLKGILSTHGIHDVHVELRESEVIPSAKLYKPVATSVATVRVLEPFSTAVGIPISTEATPSIGGTGGLFISDSDQPGKLFLLTARHVVIHTDTDNHELVKYTNPSQPRKNILLFSDPAVEAIRSEISRKEIIIEYLERRLEAADKIEPEYAEVERNEVERLLNKAKMAIPVLEKFLQDTTRDWKDPKNRVIGHIVLSPPIGLNVGEDGSIEDWAVIEIDSTKINATNFVGNVVDLGVDVRVDEFTRWMHPAPAKPTQFEYPGNRLHKFFGIIPDEEMWNLGPNTCNHENHPVIMVMKRGYASGLTVGRVNTIRSFTRYYLNDKPTTMSKGVAILPRNSMSGPFSEPGDSGSSVVDSDGRLAGLITGGAGATDILDCTYITSINFLRARMLMHGLNANFSPSLAT